MLFRHPELLYFLFALVIPIIVHLFQLRKFEKVYFSNVAFLQQIVVNSRKSSKIKKWLLLLTRLLALSALIFAFAQPFIAASKQATQKKDTAIYLDNSFSMQMPGNEMSLLKEAAQKLIPHVKNADNTLIFTNNKKISVQDDDWQNQLLEMGYTADQLSVQAIKIRAEEFFSNQNSKNQLILISDFQKYQSDSIDLTSDYTINTIPLRSEQESNLYIDKAELAENDNQKKLKIRLASSVATDNRAALTIKNGSNLLAKKNVAFEGKKIQTVNISLRDEAYEKGLISLEDNGLQYDNQLYFSINSIDQINILSINQADDTFLQRIFQGDDFSYQSVRAKQLNLADIQDADFIVINEVKNISNALKDQLIKSTENGKSICIIPDTDQAIDNYSSVLSGLNLPAFQRFNKNKKNITQINFEHPLLKNVFSKKVENFEYPHVKSSFVFGSSRNQILSYLDQTSFLAGKEQTYAFSASLSRDNSNFQSSPLIVPIFYNMALQSISDLPLYHQIGEKSTYRIKADLGEDEIVRLINENENFIPRQQSEGEKLVIETREYPKTAGNYKITKEDDTLAHVSYNQLRKESNLSYYKIDQENTFASIDAYFEYQTSKNEIVELWKWLLIFALLMLMTEILILKYIK